MSKGQYLVYERASRDEERLFLETAEEVVNEIEEPKNWKKHQDPKKHIPEEGTSPVASGRCDVEYPMVRVPPFRSVFHRS